MSDKDAQAAAEYALGALSKAERETFAQMLEEPILQTETREWERRLAPLAFCIDEVKPTSDLRARLAAAIGAEAGSSPEESSSKIVVFQKRAAKPLFKRPAYLGLGGALAACLAVFAISPLFFGSSLELAPTGAAPTNLANPSASLANTSAPQAQAPVLASAPVANAPDVGVPETGALIDCGASKQGNIQVASGVKPLDSDKDQAKNGIIVAAAPITGGLSIGGESYAPRANAPRTELAAAEKHAANQPNDCAHGGLFK